MKKEIVYGLFGLVIGALLSALVVSNQVQNKTSNDSVMQESMSSQNMMEGGMSMSGDDMMSTLKGKTGDDFDEAFMENMIEHHKSAIEMAKLAGTNAKNDEIKSLADDIITAQTSEIDMMMEWQKKWGY